MLLPNAEQAVIDPAKLCEYLLNLEHPDGSSKARFLLLGGYLLDAWEQLEKDIRSQILAQEAISGHSSPYGEKYEIVGPLTGPNGVTLSIRTVWIIRHEQNAPEFITLIPEKKV